MPLKKTIEDLILVFKEIGLSDDSITKILIKLGFTEERAYHTLLKLSLLEKINVKDEIKPATVAPPPHLVNSDRDLMEKLNELTTILKNNTSLLEQLLSLINR